VSEIVKKLLRIFVFHPFPAGAFPVLFLYARNVTEMRLAEVFQPLGWITLAVVLLTLGLVPILRDRYRRGLAVTLFVVLFFSFGPITSGLSDRLVMPGGSPASIERYTLIGLALTFLLLFWMLARSRVDLSRWSSLANQVAVGLILIQLGVAAYGHLRSGEGVAGGNEEISFLSADRTPDIYLIILDAYARSDILRDKYGYDNHGFLDDLRDRGFYVADGGTSNYVSTAQSLTSLLNMNYLHEFLAADRYSFSRAPTTIMLENNRVVSFLRKFGYATVTFATGYSPTEIEDADHYFSPDWTLSEFQNHLLNTTPIPFLMRPFLSQFDLHRRRISYTLGKLPLLNEVPGPKFVFAHISCPHPPFVFGPNGEPVDRDWPFSFSDGDHFFESGGTLDQYRLGYRNQIQFVSREILKAIDGILANSNEPPVIILQGDHGPGSGLHWESLAETDIRERFSILNSYILPGVDSGSLYQDISPVNSFRVLLNTYFGTDYEILPDQCFFTTWTEPYNFIDVTSSVRP
jgi:hypothetical protein